MTGLLGLLLCLLLAGPAARAQAPAWQAAVAATGGSTEIIASATDASGNVYVAGLFAGTIVLGATTLTSLSGTDILVAKWSPASASFVWVRKAGGFGDDKATGIAVSGTNVYVVGSFSGGVGAPFGTLNLISQGNDDAFVAKLTDAGTSTAFTWAQRMGGNNSGDLAWGVAVSGTSVYVGGEFRGTASFGAPNQLLVFGGGGSDGFLVKLTDAGPSATFVWRSVVSGNSDDTVYAVAASGTNVYVTGAFQNQCDVGIRNVYEPLIALSSAGLGDVFVAKFVDGGASRTLTWAVRAGGTGDDYSSGMAVRGASVYLTGGFSNTAVFSQPFATPPTSTLVSAGGYDAFVVKLTDTGSSMAFVWGQRAGGTGGDSGFGVAVSGSSVYLTGVFRQTASFGATSLLSAGLGDVFVAKLLDAGASSSYAWTQQAGGASTDWSNSVAISGQNVYAAGLISPPASFGPFAFAAPANVRVCFLASMRDPTLTATAAPALLAGLALAPNPAHATATVRLPAVPGAATATLTLLDGLGRTVRRQQVVLPAAGAAAEVSVAGLAPGLYRLLVQAGGQQASRALAVE